MTFCVLTEQQSYDYRNTDSQECWVLLSLSLSKNICVTLF